MSQKLSVAHIGSEDIHDLVTSLILKEVLSIIVTHIPLLESSRKVFLKFNLAVPKFCIYKYGGGVTPSIIDLNASPKSNTLEIKCSTLEIKHPKPNITDKRTEAQKRVDYSIIKSIMDFECLPKIKYFRNKMEYTREKMSKT